MFSLVPRCLVVANDAKRDRDRERIAEACERFGERDRYPGIRRRPLTMIDAVAATTVTESARYSAVTVRNLGASANSVGIAADQSAARCWRGPVDDHLPRHGLAGDEWRPGAELW